MTMGRLEDSVAVVFGAGSSGPGWGNGKATAVTFARAGAMVIAVDLNRDAAEETRAIIAAEGGRVEAGVADVTEPPRSRRSSTGSPRLTAGSTSCTTMSASPTWAARSS